MNEKTPRENAGRIAGMLRKQLTDMMAAAYDLSHIVSSTEKGREYISIINRGFCQQLRMVRRLELEHRLTGEDEVRVLLRPEDITGMCEEVVEEVQGLVRDLGIRVNFSAPREPVIVCADRGMLEDMLIGLISNSVRAVGREGEIEISLKRENGKVVFTVADNGGGADASVMAGFFGHAEEETDAPAEPSLGLGLPLARRIAALHNGFVLVDNYEGKGMRLVVSIADDLPNMGEGTLRSKRPMIDEGGWSKVMVELSECLPVSLFVPEEFDL